MSKFNINYDLNARDVESQLKDQGYTLDFNECEIKNNVNSVNDLFLSEIINATTRNKLLDKITRKIEKLAVEIE